MSEMSDPSPEIPSQTIAAADVIRALRRKQGHWVTWGKACFWLQKQGYNPQKIFEETGFEPAVQNQIIVAAQVYASLVAGGASEMATTYFKQRGSDILYEFRILTQEERVAAAEFALARGMDADAAHELAKAYRELTRLTVLPEGFTNHPGDGIAFQCWQSARQQSDLQERSRLVAKGLRFAHSDTARQKIEQLLTGTTATQAKSAPRLPFYRLEEETEMPRVIPVVGKLPLTILDIKAVPLVEEFTAFHIVKFDGAAAWVAIPSWQVIMQAQDAIAILGSGGDLPTPLPNADEDVLIVVDRTQRQWNSTSYFITADEEQLTLRWFEQQPDTPLLGRVILILRPPQILDQSVTKDLWQLEE